MSRRAEVEQAAARRLADDGWVTALLAPMVASLAADPWAQPPLAAARDRLRIGALLHEEAELSVTGSVLDADALAAAPPPTSVVVPGRLTLIRFVRAGGVRLRRWRVDGAGVREGRVSHPDDGTIVRLDGRRTGWLLEGATLDVVTLTATLKLPGDTAAREFSLTDGRLLRTATLDDHASRAAMLLTFLRVADAEGASPAFAEASADAQPHLRWHAMREWLAHDARAALPRLRAMLGDRDPDVRRAAVATLPKVVDRLQCRA